MFALIIYKNIIFMRKLTLLILFNFILVFSYAQDEVNMLSKRGVFILPEAGDIGLAVDAIPIVNYFGNAANGNAFNTGAFNFVDGTNTIVGKYMLTESSDVRVKFRFGKGRTKDVEYITRDSLPVPDPMVKVEDIEKSFYSNYTIGLGYEMSRGKGRVQGFYGAELLIQYVGGHNTYEYGNSFTSDFASPQTTDFHPGTINSNITTKGRVLENKGMNTFGFGLRGFVGVEYFFTPKISIGGEFGWGPGIAKTSDYTQTEEYWDGLKVQTEETKVAGGSSWAIDTDNSSGGVFLTFYF